MNITKKVIISLFWSFILIFLLVFLDQYTKLWAFSALHNKDPFVIIKNILEFQYLEGGNTGAAWGFLSGHLLLLSFISIAVFLIICAFIIKISFVLHGELLDKALRIKFSIFRIVLMFLAAGAFGNFIDRILRKYVIDFIYFKLIDFPIFNVADCYVVVAVIVMAIMMIFFLSDDELKQISLIPSKKKGLENEQ